MTPAAKPAENVPVLALNSEQERQIREIAGEAYPHECCGILGGRSNGVRRTVTGIFPARNERADSPRNRYLISPEFHLRVHRDLAARREEIVGFFHSHPDSPARPSEYDREHAWPWYSYVIVSVVRGSTRELLSWTLKDDRSAFDQQAVEVEVRMKEQQN